MPTRRAGHEAIYLRMGTGGCHEGKRQEYLGLHCLIHLAVARHLSYAVNSKLCMTGKKVFKGFVQNLFTNIMLFVCVPMIQVECPYIKDTHRSSNAALAPYWHRHERGPYVPDHTTSPRPRCTSPTSRTRCHATSASSVDSAHSGSRRGSVTSVLQLIK